MKTVASTGAFYLICTALLALACTSADTIALNPDLVEVVPASETVSGDVEPEVVPTADLATDDTSEFDAQQPDVPKPCVPTCLEKGCGESDGCGGVCYDAESCDDGHDCTLDQCIPEEGTGCVHHPLHHLCESSGPCLAVVCDQQEGCVEEALEGFCDDGDLCTADDQCVEGVCQGTVLQAEDCDDNNECTTDSCESQQGCVHENLEGDCTFSTDWLSGHCEEGLCIPDSVSALPCLVDDDCALLNNANLCDGRFICGLDSQCVYSTDDIPECPTDDDSQCLANLCNPADGQCQLTPINQGLPCNDGTVCTLNDTCLDGECTAGDESLICFDNNPCTDDSCDHEDGCVFTVLEGGCDDGNPCTHNDWCAQGVCWGQQYLCDDELDCTLDICDGQGGCDFGQIEPGKCLLGDSCYEAQVASGSDACLSCDPQQDQTNWSFSPPGSPCPLPHADGGCLDGACLITQCIPGFESCDPSDENGCETNVTADPENCGQCDKPCADGQACHDEECVDQCPGGSNACDGSCPDLETDPENCGECGFACLSQDHSLTGICQNQQCGLEPCPDGFKELDGHPGNGCEYACADGGLESCDGVDNDCDGQIDEGSCDDSVDCTVDVCNVQTGCQNAPLDALCEDGNDCTSFHCDATEGCLYADIAGSCDDGDACTVDDQCVSGICQGVTIADCCLDDAECDDGNPCTKDRCLPETLQCDSSPEPLEGVPCDLDGDGCTLESCQAGLCTALAAVDCDGLAGVCQSATCQSLGPLGFACNVQQLPLGNPCDDGMFCTAGDACDEQGACVPDGDKDCSQEAGQCSLGVCDELADQCVVFPLPDATPCDADADGCTLADACVAGQCVAGDGPDCSAVGYACNPGACLSLAADSYVCVTAPGPADVACDDGLFCTENDQCDDQGNCSGQQKVCPGGDSGCIMSACDEGTQSCVDTPVEDGYPCSDGVGCTLVDQCVNGLCIGTQDGCVERRLNTASKHVWFHNPQEGLAAVDLGAGRAAAVWRAGDLGLDAQIVDSEMTKLAPTLDLGNGWPPQQGTCGTTLTRQAVAASPSGDWLVVSAYKWRHITTNNCGYTSSNCTWAVYYTLSYKVLDFQGDVVKEWTDIIHDKNLYSHTTGYYGCNCGCGHSEMPAADAKGNDRIWTVAFTDGNFGILHKVDAGPYQYFAISPELEVSDPLVPDPEGVMREPKLCTLANDQVMVVYHDEDFAVNARFLDKSGQPSGDPLPVSDIAAGHQNLALCKGFADGKSVVSFTSCAADGPCQVHAQVLKPNGAPLGPTVTASQTGDGTLRSAGKPLTFADGSFALPWEEAGADADGYAALARLYDKSLNALGETFRLHKGQDNDQRGPVLVANADDFIAFWDWRVAGSEYDLFFRKFDAQGNDLSASPERQLSDGSDGQQMNGDAVGMDQGFAAVWESENLDGDQSGVALRLFDNDGVPATDDLQVNQTAPGQQSDPAIAWQEATGNLLVTWTADGQSNGTGVFGRLLNSDGGALSQETKISEGVEGPEAYSDVASLAGGKYVVVWQGYANLFFLTQVYGVVLDDSGALTGLPFVANQTSAGEQVAPAVAATGGDNPGYVIAWTQDGDDAAVLARKFFLDDTPAGAETVLDTFGSPEQVTLDAWGENLLVCWLAGGKIICQALDSQLVPLGGQTEPAAEGDPANPLVLFRDADTAWIAFDSPQDSGGQAVVRQPIASSGAVDAASALLNWTESGDQTAPFAARLSNGRAVVGWTDSENDGDSSGLYFRILD